MTETCRVSDDELADDDPDVGLDRAPPPGTPLDPITGFHDAQELFNTVRATCLQGRDGGGSSLRHRVDLLDPPERDPCRPPPRPLREQQGGFYNESGLWKSEKFWIAHSAQDAEKALLEEIPHASIEQKRDCLRRRGRKSAEQKALYLEMADAVARLRERRGRRGPPAAQERFLAEALETSRSTIARLARTGRERWR